jgi:protein TonB
MMAISITQAAAGQNSNTGGLAHSATPATNPATWIEKSDAPKSVRKLHVQGTLRFTLSIDPQGKIVDCVVDQSTGNIDLDAATCEALKRRGRFIPAKDADGMPTSGSYHSLANWKL